MQNAIEFMASLFNDIAVVACMYCTVCVIGTIRFALDNIKRWEIGGTLTKKNPYCSFGR